VNQAFSALTPEQGYNGDEDQGLMGSLSVLMKIGLFQMTGGVEEDPYYEIGSPLFDAVTINLNQKYYPGSTIQIAATNNSDGNRYIQSAMIAGKPLTSFRVKHCELVKGTKLIFEMGPEPNKSWGIE
jgi:putative alpha-1,2-mannosidase